MRGHALMAIVRTLPTTSPGGNSAMIRLRTDADYRARLHELLALEDIADCSVDLARRARQQGDLHADLACPLEAFAEAPWTRPMESRG